MKIFTTLQQIALFAFLTLMGNPSHAQTPPESLTTLKNLYSRSDFIGWIEITDQRYEMIPYEREDGEKDYTIATINTFKVIEEIKRTPGTPNHFISIGGDYPEGHPNHGRSVYQTSEVYFQPGEKIFVHLKKNELLFNELQVPGVDPGSRRGAVFLIDDSGPIPKMIPYYRIDSRPSATDKISSDRITPDSYVITLHRARIDYESVKNMYIEYRIW